MLKIHRNPTNAGSFLSAAVLILAGAVFFGARSADMRNISTMELVRDMGLGINLGNTFESNGDWITGNTVNAYETAWGSPTITKSMIDGYADAGFKTVRIPVAWSNLMTGNESGGSYAISAALLNRVEEVVDWVLTDNMYAIINIHHDGGWWEKFSTDSANCMKKYIGIWTQISDKFKDKSDYLMFESLNEEGKWQDVWNMWSNSGDKARAYGLLNAINQKFVDIVRASGGDNGERHLLIAGYDTNIDRTRDPAFRMPADPKSRCAVSVHYYDPFGFTHIDKDGDWTPYLATWGTQADINSLNTEINKMKTDFVDKGIPVIIGEYGFASRLNEERGRDQAQVRNYTLKVAEAIYTRNMCPVLWDIQLNASNGEVIYYYDRHSSKFVDRQLTDGFKTIAGENTLTVNDKIVSGKATPKRPRVTVRGKTLTVPAAANSTLKVRIIDVRGKVRAGFKAVGSGSFSINEIPAGAYIVEVIKDGYKTMSAITLR